MIEFKPADETLWHKSERAPLFAKFIGPNDGLGQIWRRWYNGKWEYKRDPETEQSFANRQW